MQPYFFPYIGYFQLINAVDTFVVFDDVNYIKKGWINRNNILVNGNSILFSVPLKEVSQNKLINQILIDENSSWNMDLLKTITISYKKTPYFLEAIKIVSEILLHEEQHLAKFITFSLQKICEYLNINTKIILSSEIEKDSTLKAQDKIIEICRKLDADHYINAIGGKALYDKEVFSKNNIKLNFIESRPIHYQQFKNEFIPWLSIIDVMMFNSVDEIKAMLNNYELG